MPSYKLHYFKAKGRGEVSRILFALGDQQYEDIRYEGEQWKEFKPKTPFGGMPVLEVDGQQFGQSRAIERFLAKKFGLYGATPEDQFHADMVVDCVEEIMIGALTTVFIPDEQKKKEAKKAFEPKGNLMLQNLEKLVIRAKGYGLKKVSWPEVCIFSFMEIADGVDDMTFDKSKIPEIVKICEKVKSDPKVAAWIAKRPK